MKSLNGNDKQNRSEPRRFRVLRIIAGLAVAAMAVVLAQRYLMPSLTVERIDDAELGFQTLIPGSNSAWLFRYRGGLVDCWLEEDRDNGVNIIQTVAISQELDHIFRLHNFRYGVIFLKLSFHEGQQVLELSHWGVYDENGLVSTLIGQKTLVKIPEGRAAFVLHGTQGRRSTPDKLMAWSFETKVGFWREVRLMCGKPKAVIVRGQD